MKPEVAKKIADFFEQYPVRSYKKGQILIHASDNPEEISYLVSGRVKQYDLTDRGDEVVLNIFKPPAYFPMSYAINRTPNTYFYEADSDLELCRAPFDEVITFLHDNPDVLYDLLGRVYLGIDGMIRRMSHLMFSPAKSRVLYELIIECQRFGIEVNGVYDINLNESDIGARAGLSRETVSREISKLKSEGLIDVVNRQITILDIEKLGLALSKEDN
jgi:CRP/FNR family transcriptional regulator